MKCGERVSVVPVVVGHLRPEEPRGITLSGITGSNPVPYG
jgi:hypothetical protein